MKFMWKRYGGYEVSGMGDKRFSAFNAILSDGRSIEQHYQCDVKGYDPGGRKWKLGKSKPPLTNLLPAELWSSYLALWHDWAEANPELMKELREHAIVFDGTLSDRFATTEVNQAHALAVILNRLEED